MASSATSTILLSPVVPEIAVVKTFGNYKEQAAGAKAYNKTLEEEGDANHPKANVIYGLGFCGLFIDWWIVVHKLPPYMGQGGDIFSSDLFHTHRARA